MKKAKYKIYRCYLVSVTDESDNEVASDFCFLPKEQAKIQGEQMLKEYLEKREKENE